MTKLEGIIHGLEEETYHAHHSLSSTGARKLLDSPARFRHYIDNPQPGKTAFDLGHAAHAKVLGIGAAVVAYGTEHITPSGAVSTSKATLEWAAEQRAAGLTPVSADQIVAVDLMAESIMAHPEAKRLFEQHGDVEASVFATDPTTGVDMRARFDFLPSVMQADPWTVDLKTTSKSAAPDEFAKTVANFGYHIQQEWYLRAYELVNGDVNARMKFVVVETSAPYLVGVYELALEFAEIGHAAVKRALETYAACAAANIWPGYPVSNDPLLPPNWLIYSEGMDL